MVLVLVSAWIGVALAGPNSPALIIIGTVWALLSIFFLLLVRKADRSARRTLDELGVAIGCENSFGADDIKYTKSIIASLCVRLERAAAYKAAFNALETPALLVDKEGEIIAASAGFLSLNPAATPLSVLSSLFGDDFVLVADAGSRKTRVTLDGRPYDYVVAPLATERSVIGFTPSGLVVGRGQLKKFTNAIADGKDRKSVV